MGARWHFAPSWTVRGDYELEWGPGGFLNSADVSVRRSFGERFAASLAGTSFQQIEQFRLGDGRAWGGNLAVDAVLADRFTVVAGGSVIRHSTTGDGVERPWNQMRGWTSLRIDLGSDPGPANRVRR